MFSLTYSASICAGTCRRQVFPDPDDLVSDKIRRDYGLAGVGISVCCLTNCIRFAGRLEPELFLMVQPRVPGLRPPGVGSVLTGRQDWLSTGNPTAERECTGGATVAVFHVVSPSGQLWH